MKQIRLRFRKNPRKGSMLIVSLAVLALLSMLAVAFSVVMAVELEASRSEINQARARFITMAGIEAAVAELQEQCKSNFYTSPTDSWVFEPSYPDGCGAVVELEASTKLSYVRTSTRKILNGSSVSRIISGEIGVTYASGLDYYKLKIWDSASRININGNQDSLPLMLEHLGAGIALYAKIPNPVPAGKGQALVDYRRNTGENRFLSVKELQEVLGDDAGLNLSYFVTFNSWKDPATKKTSSYR